MPNYIADDVEAIAKRIREIEQEEKGEAPKQETPQISPAEQEPVYWGDGAGVYW